MPQMAPRPDPEPFPDVPEIRVGRGFGATVRLMTDSVREVHEIADQFLRIPSGPSEDPRQAGRTVAIVGPFGAGKSHLAAELIERVQTQTAADESSGPPIIITIHAKVNGNLVDLYQQMFRSPGEDDGLSLDGGDALHGVLQKGVLTWQIDRLYKAVRAQLERGERSRFSPERDNNMIAFPREPGLSDAEMAQEFRRQLAHVVGDSEYANALSLLKHERAEYSQGAWLWLKGGRPDAVQRQILEDRGVSGTITDGARAETALRALALLFARTGTKLVVVIDEVQNLWQGEGHTPAQVATTLDPLLSAAGATGALLVLCGLADFWRVLPESVHQRTETETFPAAMAQHDIVDYYQEARHLQTGVRPPGSPFDDQALALIHEITGGHWRNTISLCRQTYRLAGPRRPITSEIVRQAAMKLSGPESPEDLKTALVKICAQLGRQAFVDQAPPDMEAKADLWIPGASPGSGCAIQVSRAVLDTTDLRAVLRRARALQTMPAGKDPTSSRALILVVIGMVSDNISADLSRRFAGVLIWERNRRGFEEELRKAIDPFLPTVAARAETDLLQRLETQLRELTVARVDDRRFFEDLISQQVRRTSGSLLQMGSQWSEMSPVPVIDFGRSDAEQELSRNFNETILVIRTALQRAEYLWQAMFRPGASGKPIHSHEAGIQRLEAPGERLVLPSDMTDLTLRRAMDTLLALLQALRGFGLGVMELRRMEAEDGISRKGELNYQCQRFDEAVEALLSQMPSAEEDAQRTIPRVMDVDHAMLIQRLRRLGAITFDALSSQRNGTN
jgi:Cdc6-like AAA superfamily ATPase